MFDSVVGTLAGEWRLITVDRRGWGKSIPADEYRRTSIAEQSIEIASILRELEPGPVTAIGIGLGGVVCLEMALADPDLVARTLLIEPPVFGAISAATEGMSADVDQIRLAASEGGEEAAYELFLSGGLPTLGAGAERFATSADRGRHAARAFLVELPAVPSWPLDPLRLATLEAEVTVVTLPSTPELLRHAADAVTDRVPGAESVRSSRDGMDAVAPLIG